MRKNLFFKRFFFVLKLATIVAIDFFVVYQQVCWFRDGSMNRSNFWLCVMWFVTLCLASFGLVKVFFPSSKN